MADAVTVEPVSAANFAFFGNLTGVSTLFSDPTRLNTEIPPIYGATLIKTGLQKAGRFHPKNRSKIGFSAESAGKFHCKLVPKNLFGKDASPSGMVAVRIILGWNDSCEPTVKSVAEALEKLSSLGCDLETGSCWIEVPPSFPGKPRLVARIIFAAANDDRVRIDLPMLEGCRARTTLGAPIYLALEAFEQAKVDPLGNVSLRDGIAVHAVSFDTVRFPGPWTDLEKAIVWLTIRAFKAEHIFVRRQHHGVGIDYGILRIMREPNVKDLARFINEHIGQLQRGPGQPPFEPVSVSKIQRTLNIAGIGKVRGHRQRVA